MISILRAAIACAVADAVLAALIAWRSGSEAGGIGLHVLFGAAIGALTAVIAGAAIRRYHSAGCIGAIAAGIALLALAAWMATSTDQVATAATLALAFPLWTCACAITGLMVKPYHPDRR